MSMKKGKIFKVIGYGILIIFLGLFLSLKTGYYETEEHQKMVLTNEQILAFEKDVQDGKNVNIENYLEVSYVDYSNNFSKKMNKLSLSIENAFITVLKKIFKEAANMIE